MIFDKIQSMPLGYSEAIYKHKRYGVTKTVFNHGQSIKIFAEELGGNDFVSLNYYITSEVHLLKPCEMPKAKVIHFLNQAKAI